MFNTVLAGIALDGKSFFYVNPLSVVPEACQKDERLRHVKPVRQKWFGCACCPPNIARLLSSVGQYAYTQGGDTLYTHLYMSGSVRARFEAGEMTLRLSGNMPWEGDVRVRIEAEQPVRGTLAFRIPGWSENASHEAKGKEARVKDGYLFLSGVWQDGDEIALHFPMPVRMVKADPRVRELIGQAAFVRGPVTYCAEEADNGAQLHLLRADADAAQRAKVCVQDVFGHETLCLNVPGRREVLPQEGALYAPAQPSREEDADIRLIPYYAWANRGEGEMRVWLRT